MVVVVVVVVVVVTFVAVAAEEVVVVVVWSVEIVCDCEGGGCPTEGSPVEAEVGSRGKSKGKYGPTWMAHYSPNTAPIPL